MSRSRRTVAPEDRTSLTAAPWVRGPEWDTRGWRQPGWALLPLRLFLGVTFVFAALQKLVNPSFFDASSPSSVQAQMRAVAPASPIRPLVELSLHGGWVVGLLIALGELAVGLGTVLGLRARLAAVGGALLALSFFLTVSWTTAPYYYGADIVFLFAWTPFVAVGAAGVLSVDAYLADRRLALGSRSASSGVTGRRAVLGVGVGAAGLALVTVAIGRILGSSARSPGAVAGGRSTGTRRTPAPGGHGSRAPSRRASRGGKPPAGTQPVADAAAVGVGQGVKFNDPATGQPAWLVRSASGRYDAFSAVCTHAGCTVDFDSAGKRFVCPCHGGTFSADDGHVIGGPPPSPLTRIKVALSGRKIYAR